MRATANLTLSTGLTYCQTTEESYIFLSISSDVVLGLGLWLSLRKKLWSFGLQGQILDPYLGLRAKVSANIPARSGFLRFIRSIAISNDYVVLTAHREGHTGSTHCMSRIEF